jgi:phenylalanyl-tRNA synthetase alpha chain
MSENISGDEIPHLSGYGEAELDQAFGSLTLAIDADAASLRDANALEQFRLRWNGRKQGRLQAISHSWLKVAPKEAKKIVGEHFARLKEHFDREYESALLRVARAEIGRMAPHERARAGQLLHEAYRDHREEKIRSEAIDITLPGTRRRLGAEHPLIKTLNELVSIFARIGYSVGVGPEVETDYYNFESLNFPPGHPARDTQDTLVIANQERKPLRDRLLMRTHTSPVQIHTMEEQPPPVRIVIPGKVHRNDAADATHSPIFHQLEGLCVDTNITFADLKGTLDHAMKELFGSSVRTRFFPSFFPFTEPSADVQISCPFCGGKGCRKCKHSGWIELLGCGMVDPAVFAFAQQKQPAYDPKKISGFAFGMGIDRIAMMKYGITDISLLYSGDLRFLEQFA